nr:DUF6786 family protein [Allomuricauda sp.]
MNLQILLVPILMVFVLLGCKPKAKTEVEQETLAKDSFGYDVAFMTQHFPQSFVLGEGQSKILVTPELQGRVMTSTLAGDQGSSFGWINYKHISSKETNPQFNPYGGEERFWIGPEGGQFSIYFKPGTDFNFENWKVPTLMDTEAFQLVDRTEKQAHFHKKAQLVNHSNNDFEISIDRTVRLLDANTVGQHLDISIPNGVKMVGFETENVLTNDGNSEWTKETGMLSIWILSMFKPSDKTVVVVPFKTGDPSNLGQIVTDNYFGKVPADRLPVVDSVIFFKADGNKRSKIGLSPRRTYPIMGSYDPNNKMLTIAQFTLESNQFDYVNSLWKLQDDPFAGDAVNSYNDGPLEDGGQLGPFYELESSSRAADLAPNESLTHFHRTFHFTGDEEQLDMLCLKLLHTSLEEVKRSL